MLYIKIEDFRTNLESEYSDQHTTSCNTSCLALVRRLQSEMIASSAPEYFDPEIDFKNEFYDPKRQYFHIQQGVNTKVGPKTY